MTEPTFGLGEGIFLIKDIAAILKLDKSNVRRWIGTYWDSKFATDYEYSHGEGRDKAVNFYTLIEFYTFYKLRENGFSAQYISKIHDQISKELRTPYPFAISGISHDHSQIWYEYLENVIKADGKGQFSIRPIIKPFLSRIEFDSKNLAERYYPLKDSKNIVVDPKHQLGQPTIKGTNIKTETIYGLYKGGESKKDIGLLYDLSSDKIRDAIRYHDKAA